ncbi:MAG: hypothetical protein EOS36_14935 [Mesorhizobium sp.]|uniref:hypothetical protein n=1 Tax=Mesorhizobium sp. TaxID=1871066 RepID=UPI000FE68661|nr:hypothetical protein [Mesorhizobium sp.]RWD62555.1 MAG: hypothetical protein EOS36_14935 [Mesorhizobium sp.]RWE39614.1 MAG: hypothetical protein EOS79_20540 [Mesorhizobium sp.]
MTDIKPGHGVDLLIRLGVLHTKDADQARSAFEKAYGITIDDDALCEEFERLVETSIGADLWQVVIPYDLAEQLVVLLKSRKRQQKRPRDTRIERISKEALIMTARQRKDELMAAGMSADEARRLAAQDASDMAGKRPFNIGPMSATTIERRMSRKRK